MTAEPAPPRRVRLGRALRRAAGGFVLLAVSGLIALLLAEVVVRLFAPQQLIQIRPDLWQPADTIGWLRRPNANTRINTGERTVSVITDRDGYRIGNAGRTEGAQQVLLIGDSFMEALQVEHEQTTAHLLQESLTARAGRVVAVRNAGVAGWGPSQYLIRARQLMGRDAFGLLVVAVFVGNDAVEYRFDHSPPRQAVRRHELRLPRRASWSELVDALLAPLNDALEVRSHLYVLLKNQMSTLRMRLGMTADYFPPEFRRDDAGSPRWRNTGEIARDIAALAARHGTPVLFVLIPERLQVYEADFDRYLSGFGIDSSTVDLEQPTRLLLASFQAHGLQVLDALPAFRSAARDGPRLFGTVDQHLSARGHDVLAAAIAPAAASLLRR